MREAQGGEPISARAVRFSQRLRGEPVYCFADLQRKSRVDRLANMRRSEIAAIVALLDARKAIDAELNGRSLGAIADMVGEGCFDHVCEAQIDPAIYDRGADALPLPGVLSRRGEKLMQCLDRSEDVAHLVEIAANICAETPEREVAA